MRSSGVGLFLVLFYVIVPINGNGTEGLPTFKAVATLDTCKDCRVVGERRGC